MDYENIMQILTNVAPMITAIATIIATVIVSVKKCKAIANDSQASIKESTDALAEEQAKTQRELKELTLQIHDLIVDNATLRAENEKLIVATEAKVEAIRNVKKASK